MPGEPQSHYDTLGVPRSAPAAEIKRAYFKLVRKHSPENDPEGFRRISDAYAVLIDPEARAVYDSETAISPGMRATLIRAAELAATDPPKAGELLRQTIAPRGTPLAALLFAAQLSLRVGLAPLALRIAERAIAEAPADDTIHVVHGEILVACGRHAAGVEVFQRFLVRHPGHLVAAQCLADALHRGRRYADALRTLDAVVASVGAPGLELHAIHRRRFAIAAEAGLWPDASAAIEASGACIPPDDADARRHIAWVWSLHAERLESAGNLRGARMAVNASLACAGDPRVRLQATRIDEAIAAAADTHAALAGDSLPEWIRAILLSGGRLSIVSAAGGVNLDATKDLALADLEWDGFKSAHPRAAAGAAELWGELRRQCAEYHEEADRRRRAARAENVRGVLFAVGAFLLIAICAIIADLRSDTPSLFRSRPSGSAPR